MRKSINKTTVIIVLAFFLVLSVGYALFSDTITIEGTATAQGNFNITATCITNLDDTQKELVFESAPDIIADNGYENESCIVLDDKVTYSVGLKYPTASKVSLIKFTNTGDINAKFNLEDYVISIEEGYNLSFYNSITNELINKNEEYSKEFISVSSMFFQKNDDTYILDSGDESEEFVEVSDDAIYFVLEPEQSLYIILENKWPNATIYSNSGEYYVAKQDIKIDWIQAVGN